MAFNLTAGQWYTAKYRYSYTGESGTARIAEIHEDEYDNRVGGVTPIVGSGRGFVSTRYEIEGDDEYAPFRPSTTTLQFFDTNEAFVSDMLGQLNQVGDKYAVVIREDETLDWVGYVDPQNLEFSEQGPIAMKVEASCGLKKRLDESPYLDDPSATFTVNEGAITLSSAIAKMLGTLGYGLDFWIASTIKPLSSNFTAIDGDEKCPLRYIWTNEIAFTSGTEDEYGVISSKAALKIILEAFGLTIFQAKGAWHITQVNLRHGSTYRRWQFDSAGVGGTPLDAYETFDPRTTLSDEELERSTSKARFVPAYSSVITQYKHGKVRYLRRPGFQVGTIREAENWAAGTNPWTESGTASIQPLVADDLACRITRIDGDIENATGFVPVSTLPDELGNADDSLSAFTTLVNGNTVSQESATVYAGTTLRFESAAYCDAYWQRGGINNRVRPDYILFQLYHDGMNKYAYFKTDGSLGWQAGANWCVYINSASRNDWTTFGHDFGDATTADGKITVTMGPLFEDEFGTNNDQPQGWEYIWWDNVNIKPILAAGEKDTEATSVVNFVNGARSNPRPRNLILGLGDGPAASNRTALFTDIGLTTVTGNWEQTAGDHSGTSTGVSLSRIVGAALLKSMNQYRRVRDGGYPGTGDVLTPLDTIDVSGDLYVPLEIDINWATEVTSGSWYLANEQAFTSDLVEGISTGFSGFTQGGKGQSSGSANYYNRIGSSFDTLLARESDRLGTVATAATSGVAVVVAGAGLSSALEVGDPVFFQNKQTGYVMKREVATYTDVNNFTVTSAFTATENIGVGDPILPGSIAGLRIDLDGVQIVNTHLKNDGLNAWNGTVDASGSITAGGTQGWIITRTGEAEFKDVNIKGSIELTASSSGITFFTDAGPLVSASNLDGVPDGATYGRVALAGLSAGAVLLSQATGNLGDIADGGGYGKVNSTSISAGNILLASAVGDLDDISDGTGYARVNATSISAGNILLSAAVGDLDDIGDGTTYNRVLATDISAGKIILSAALGDLDDIDDGTNFGKIKNTILSAGYIQVGTGTKDSTLSGFHLDENEFVGQSAGVDQVVLNTSGQVTAAAGDIVLDSNGLVIDSSSGANLVIKAFGSTHLQFLPVPIGSYDVININASDIAFHTATGSAGTASLILHGDGFFYTNPTLRIGPGTDLVAEGVAQFDDDATFDGRIVGGYRILKAITSDVTVANTASATSLISDTLAAAEAKSGDVIVVRASGTVNWATSPAPTLTFRVGIGGTTAAIQTTPLNTSSSGSGHGWEYECRITLRSATSAVALEKTTLELSAASGSEQTKIDHQGPTTISSVETGSRVIDLDLTWNTASASNSLTCKEAAIWIESPNT